MRSPRELAWTVLLLGLIGLLPAPVSAQPSDDEIARAVQQVKADPLLGIERTIKEPRWRGSDRPPARPGLAAWLRDMFRWFDQSARWLMWIVIVVAAAAIAGYLVHLARAPAAARPHERLVPPTHVQDLDIRPESLPSDVGAAARLLWDRGDHRAALSLLYRGLLSRLVHDHRVPIRDSSTEGDCVALAAAVVEPRSHEYVRALVRVWQRAVYGREPVGSDAVHALCDEFAAALTRRVRVEESA